MKILSQKRQALLLLFSLITINLFSQQFVEQNDITLTGIRDGSTEWCDLDNDGYLDIILTGNDGSSPVSKIFWNNGNNTFDELPGVDLEGVYQGATATGDFNNDGFLDILLTGRNISTKKVSQIYRNNGDHSFVELTDIQLKGVYSGSPDWGDYDNDGDLDILLTGYSDLQYISEIYCNNGDNTFTLQTNISLPGVGNGSSAFVDYDNDGYLDIFLSGSTSLSEYISKLFRNNGNNTFTEQTNIIFPMIGESSADWCDYNNDGFPDVLFTGRDPDTGQGISKIYRNMGDNTFIEQTNISLPGLQSGSVAWGNYNDDEYPDILLSGLAPTKVTKIYRNNGDNSFTEQIDIALTGVYNGSVTWGDYDNDNNLDFLLTGAIDMTTGISKIYRNETEVINTPPLAPLQLSHEIQDTQAVLKWEHAVDDVTPSAGMTYNVRFGTSSGNIDVISPHSMADGSRLIPSYGNVPADTFLILRNLKKGIYFWSVQAIDNTYTGGPFSSELSFEITAEIQSSMIFLTESKGTSQSIQWARGNGTKCIVFVKEGNTGTVELTNNTTYIADEAFGSGSPAGDWFCVYNGTGCSVTLTDLDPYTEYLYQAIEYDGSPGNEQYFNLSGINNPLSFRTSPFIEQTGVSIPGTFYSSTAWGDYNNDGYLDLLLSGMYTNSKVYHINGDGSFTQEASLAYLTMSSAAWGDYNNDGFLDILMTGDDMSWNPVSVIYLNNGGNTFAEQGNISLTPVSEGSVAWGDYDNDGDLDILLTGNSGLNKVAIIYRNNGNGTFNEQAGISLTGVSKSAVAWFDYNRDGFQDIMLTGQDITEKLVAIIYRNNGDNTFTAQTDISLTGVYAGSIACGDYDNDGFQDILLSGGSSIGIGVPANPVTKIYHNDGNGNFTELTNTGLAGVFNSSIAWTDYDNDGLLDILLSGISESGYISKLYHNQGDHMFAEQTNVTLEGLTDGSISWGDYDNDGRMDLVQTGYNGSEGVFKLYKNFYPDANTAPDPPTGLTHSMEGCSLKFTWESSTDGQTPSTGLTYNIRVGKTPGSIDVISPMSLDSGFRSLTQQGNTGNDTSFILKNIFPGDYYWSVQAIDNNLKGSTFVPEQIFTVDSIQAHNLTASLLSGTSLSVRWSRGNGQRCIVFCKMGSTPGALPVENTTYIHDNIFGYGDQIGSTGWYCIYNGLADSTNLSGLIPGYSYSIHVMEYIGSPGNEKYFREIANDNIGVFGTSIFTEETGISLPGTSQSAIALGDYDNDGYLDFLLSGSSGEGPITRIYRNNGNNTFTKQDIPFTGIFYSSVAWGDYNNDGFIDLLRAGHNPEGIGISIVYLNNGDNSFTEQNSIILEGIVVGAVAWGDYDNDNYLDILITGYNSVYEPLSKIYHNNGDSTFTEQTDISLTGNAYGSVKWGDCDNDGNLDVFLLGTNPGIYHNNGDNTFTKLTGTNLRSSYSQNSADLGDYNNDGYLDILIAGYGKTAVYCNNGNGTFTQQTDIILPTVEYGFADWGDFNNDGYLDIAISGKSESGSLTKIYCNNRDNTFTELTDVSLTGTHTGDLTWGDYDNDGDLDLLLSGYAVTGDITKIYRNNLIMKAGNYQPNKKPEPPEYLSHIFMPNAVQLNWIPVENDETPTTSMTYNVRLKQKNTEKWIAGFMADDTSGFRRLPAMGNAQTGTSYIIKNLPSDTWYWQVQAVDLGYQGGIWSAIDSFEIKNVQSFYSGDEVCLGYPTTFIDQSVATDGIASWNWDFKDGMTSTEQNPVHMFSASGTYNVKLVVTDNGGIKDSLEKDIIVRARPITGFSAADVCQGIPVTATNTTDNNGLTISSWSWNFGDGSTTTDQQPPPHPYLTAGDYSIKLKAVASNGCADSITNIVSVGAYPVAAVTANAPLTFCKGDSVTLSVPYVADYLYTWKIDETNLTDGDSSKYVSRLTGNYSVEIVNPKGNCTTNSSAIGITAQDAPTAPLISADGDLEFCQGDSVILSVTNNPEYIYQWKLNAGAIGVDSCLHSAKSSGNYSLTVSNSTGCAVDATNEVIVTVYSAPILPTVNLSGSTTFCEGDSVELSVIYNPDYTYQWENNSSIITGAESNYFKAVASGTYKLNISNSYGCITMTSPVDVTVKPMPYEPVITSDNYKAGECIGETPIKLNVEQEVPGYSYQWYRNGIPVSGATLSYMEDFLTEGDYSVETDLDGCSAESDAISIFFKDAPEKPSLSAQGPTVWYLTCSNKNADEYKWYCNGNLITDAEDYYYIAGRKMGNYQVSIKTEPGGCFTRSDIVTIPSGDTGMDDVDPFEGLKIYPNPSNGLFIAEIENGSLGDLLIKIISQDGKELFNFMYEKRSAYFSAELNISELPKGYYLISFELDKYITTRRIIID